MQGAFGTVVLVVCGVGVAGAVLALLLGRRTWEDYGRNHLVMERTPSEPSAGSAAAVSERDEEIRQMLEARNARRRRRGEAELDVEEELGRLTAPAVDDELRAEIRDMVIARNHRRARGFIRNLCPGPTYQRPQSQTQSQPSRLYRSFHGIRGLGCRALSFYLSSAGQCARADPGCHRS